MIKKRQLEIILSKLKGAENPKVRLEQYMTPSSLAAQMVSLASVSGDIEDKTVFDLGCGTGALSIAAALCGAKKVVGVDVDEDMISIARSNAENLDLDIEFVKADIADFIGECDTVVQNPPFGMRGKEHADRAFIKKALECGRKVYSLHRGGYDGEIGSQTREFLVKFVESLGGRVLAVKEFKFDVPYIFKFHKKPRVSYNVDLFVIERSD